MNTGHWNLELPTICLLQFGGPVSEWVVPLAVKSVVQVGRSELFS